MLDAIVAVLEEQHTGGEDFFNALDDALLEPGICKGIYDMIRDPHRYSYILTGSFGQYFLKWMNANSKPYAGYLLYPGGLRDGLVRAHTNHYFTKPDLWMMKTCFVDDSIYSGTTRSTAIHQLMVSKEIETYVAYDGMLEAESWCRSLYRYHVGDANA